MFFNLLLAFDQRRAMKSTSSPRPTCRKQSPRKAYDQAVRDIERI